MTKQDEIVTELLPCPFCGGEAELSDLGDPRDDSFISCSKCGVQQIANYTPELAAARWNTRTATRSAGQERGDDDALISRLEDMRDYCLSTMARPHPNNVARLCEAVIDRLQAKAPETDYCGIVVVDEDEAPEPSPSGVSTRAQQPRG